jgi:hypothetical protein
LFLRRRLTILCSIHAACSVCTMMAVASMADVYFRHPMRRQPSSDHLCASFDSSSATTWNMTNLTQLWKKIVQKDFSVIYSFIAGIRTITLFTMFPTAAGQPGVTATFVDLTSHFLFSCKWRYIASKDSTYEPWSCLLECNNWARSTDCSVLGFTAWPAAGSS